ncbi:hypothetical protein [Streptomyces sp. NPDC058066]|uniref:hypothetical protein n=1 Tax=Streptomyces sp. NPDC058066 TaxID=3346323 RepID=UPI0036EB5473
MSQDYAAIIASLNGAVLVVGTIQYGTLIRKATDAVEARLDEELTFRGKLIQASRGGVAPSADDLLRLKRRRLPAGFYSYILASLVYLYVCQSIARCTKDVLKWSGSAKQPPNPELAERAWEVAAVAILLLLIEAGASAWASGYSQLRQRGKLYEQTYSEQERTELRTLIANATPPVPNPPPGPDPTPQP